MCARDRCVPLSRDLSLRSGDGFVLRGRVALSTHDITMAARSHHATRRQHTATPGSRGGAARPEAPIGFGQTIDGPRPNQPLPPLPAPPRSLPGAHDPPDHPRAPSRAVRPQVWLQRPPEPRRAGALVRLFEGTRRTRRGNAGAPFTLTWRDRLNFAGSWIIQGRFLNFINAAFFRKTPRRQYFFRPAFGNKR